MVEAAAAEIHSAREQARKVVLPDAIANPAIELVQRMGIDSLRAEITSTATGKLGGLLIRPAARRLRSRLDPDTYGGAYLLGLRGLVVIAHGSSGRVAITNAIRLAARGVEHDVVSRLQERLPATVVASARSTTRTVD